MEIIEKPEELAAELKVIGDLDAKSSIQLDEYLQKAFKQEQFNFYIDCAELRYISSAGLGVFISHLDFLNQHKGKFVFFNMNDQVFEIFKILGLLEVMQIAENKINARRLMNES
ncbi:MAG: STAS domain-containing protein [Chitinophagales bacterium]